ncbi:MAG: divalent-cation tolerance protein CutA [Anaerolineae bacterium]|nr:divalent-cation tolerance protein CutA [Anaerolineae bacterium]
MSAIIIITTTETIDEAKQIARGLVEGRLAACVQIVGPITSIYRWEGAVEEAAEVLCLVKTRADLFDQVEAAIQDRHSYDVPEIIAVPVERGSKPYLDWLNQCCTGGSDD